MAKNYIFKKTHEVDKEKFAGLLLVAKGNRTMKTFALECGVNPSTFTRITQMTNKGASSQELIEAIAAHADPKSGVTLEALADANGYTIEKDSGIKALKLTSYIDNTETLVRNLLVQGLLDRGQEIRMGKIRYTFSKSLSLSPDALIMTEAFGKKDEVWFVDTTIGTPRIARAAEGNPINKSRVKQMAFEKFARFVFISMNPVELFRPSRFTLVVLDREMYDIIVEEFAETVVCTDISVMYIDLLNNCIAAEFMLPHCEKGLQPSYFMTTDPVEEEGDYLTNDAFDDVDE